MKRPHLLARCMAPVAMTEDALRVCIAVVTDGEHFADERARALDAAGGMPLLNDRPPMRIEGGTATISIEGPLVRKAAGINAVSGLTSYSELRQELHAAMSDSEVKAIDWAIDSPGGEVSGLFELADEIAAARSVKPMRALVSSANSAAYVLAAAAGNIEIEQLGEAGSIGVVAGVRRPDPNGGQVIEFVSSVSPLKRPNVETDEGRAVYQARVDYAGEHLVAKVAEYRGVSVEQVKERFGAGAVLAGAQAVAAGLVDRISAGPIPQMSNPSRLRARTRRSTTKMADNNFTPNAAAETCAGCSAALGDTAYCAECAGKSTDAQAFAASALSALGCASHAEALGKLTAIVGALGELEGLRSALAAERQAARSAKLSTALSAAVADKRINLGELARVVPALLGPSRATAQAALEPLAQEAEPMIGALCAVDLSADAVEAVTAYLDAKTPVVMPAVVVPPTIPSGAASSDASAHDELALRAQRIGDETRALLERSRTK